VSSPDDVGDTRARYLRIGSRGNVRIGDDGSQSLPNGAAVLELASTTKGLLLPRMTSTERDAISGPPDGLIIYNATTGKVEARAGSNWVALH
jgi:hypothetical protein